MTNDQNHRFTGSVPEFYETYMVPMFFEPYAADLAIRLVAREPTSVLEVAAGTGVVTRALAEALPSSVPITATDLSPDMLNRAEAIGTSRPVTWKQADVTALPFDDAAFDAVVCQFGAMFFPDRPAAFAEMARVLRPGGALVFSTWDSLAHNEFARVINDAMAALFADDPPQFFARVPHGYFDEARIRADVAATGDLLAPARIDVVDALSTAASAAIPAMALCQGTPLRDEIEARDPTLLEEATTAAERAIEKRFGVTDVEGRMRAFLVTAERR